MVTTNKKTTKLGKLYIKKNKFVFHKSLILIYVIIKNININSVTLLKIIFIFCLKKRFLYLKFFNN